MHLQRLKVNGFRNLSQVDLEVNPHFNFIFGKNAQGKTNVMEVIYYLAELKSFRTSSKLDLIQKEAEFAKIEADYIKNDLHWHIDLALTKTERKLLLNNKSPSSRKQYFELIPLILFEPRHIYLFRDSPSQRRQYLNRALYLQDVGFLNLWRDYEKAITQKNRLLKDRVNGEFLDVWNERLVDLGSQIILERLKWFENAATFLKDEYENLAHLGQTFHLKYVCSLVKDEEPIPLNADINDVKAVFEDKLKQKARAEQEARQSLVGPHRDDFIAFLDERELGAYGSQGENRSAVIALKMAQLKMFASRMQKTPLFLLDDVASELDETRCRYLFEYLRDEETQVFLTTTEHLIDAQNFAGRSSSFLVENGSVSPFNL